jgi:hypothetical protein
MQREKRKEIFISTGGEKKTVYINIGGKEKQLSN